MKSGKPLRRYHRCAAASVAPQLLILKGSDSHVIHAIVVDIDNLLNLGLIGGGLKPSDFIGGYLDGLEVLQISRGVAVRSRLPERQCRIEFRPEDHFFIRLCGVIEIVHPFHARIDAHPANGDRPTRAQRKTGIKNLFIVDL